MVLAAHRLARLSLRFLRARARKHPPTHLFAAAAQADDAAVGVDVEAVKRLAEVDRFPRAQAQRVHVHLCFCWCSPRAPTHMLSRTKVRNGCVLRRPLCKSGLVLEVLENVISSLEVSENNPLMALERSWRESKYVKSSAPEKFIF